MITFWLPGFGSEYCITFHCPFNVALRQYIEFLDIPPSLQGDICFDIF